MRKMMMIGCVAAVLAACNQQAKDNKVTELKLDSDKARLSYAMGMDAGQSAKQYGDYIDRVALIAAINDRLDGAEAKLSQQDAGKVKQVYAQKLAEKREAEREALAAKNKAEFGKYLAEHSKKVGVTVTESGLHYEIIKQGDGAKPKVTDKVTVLYDGKLSDGTEFNPWHKRDKEKVLPLDNVIKGLSEGIQLMNVGSTYRFVIPPELAFGEKGAGGNIPPYSVMVFEVDLLSIGVEGPVNTEAKK